MKLESVFLFLTIVLLATPGYAHHSARVYFDFERSIEIQGEVVDFKLRNPHASLVVDGFAFIDDVRQSDEPERWEIETQSAPALRNWGVSENTFQPGDFIILEAAPNRDPDFRFVFGRRFVSDSGAEFAPPGDRNDDQTSFAYDASDEVGVFRMAGRWRHAWGRAEPGSTPLPLNAAGLEAWRNWDPKQSPANTCEPLSFPPLIHAPFLWEVRFTDEEVILYRQVYEVTRTVPLNGEWAQADPEGMFGEVRGTIEGDSLIVESRNYPASGWGLGIAAQINGGDADVPSSEQKRLTERYTLSEDGYTLFLEYTVEDPVYLTEPYSARVELPRAPDDIPMHPYECDPESAAMWSRSAGDPPLVVGDD